ncbi:universal stress protein [Croceicoccus ponticola]|uniref:Universal stress protein n=1 Tax=Croceicoccus ponticola TaxID=2217664 RepID=A0A437H1R7_9SPHN|nr:universal stress protein [Croceicoccus ponticola]RVQ69581.1 universal stress protein [Croceicoccus ponticola]
MKNVLLLVHDDDGQEARYQAALDVVRAVGGHLECLDVAIMPEYIGDYFSGAGGASLLADEREAETANRKRLEERLAREGVSWSWTDVLDDPARAIEQAADLADLIVLSSAALEEREDLRNLAGKAACETGHLVLAVPPKARGLALADTALIAWNGSHEAETALRAAVPLLALATETILFDIDDKGTHSANSAASYLSRHGIHPVVEMVRGKRDDAIYSLILERARAANAGYIVMGAFHHSRAAEYVFGGVTRSMLQESEFPLLIAH